MMLYVMTPAKTFLELFERSLAQKLTESVVVAYYLKKIVILSGSALKGCCTIRYTQCMISSKVRKGEDDRMHL